MLNAVLGFFHEAKAENAVAALARMTAVTSSLLRDGQVLRIPSAGLVRGHTASDPRVPTCLGPCRPGSCNLAGGVLGAGIRPYGSSRAPMTGVGAMMDPSSNGARCLPAAGSLRKPSARAENVGCCRALRGRALLHAGGLQ